MGVGDGGLRGRRGVGGSAAAAAAGWEGGGQQQQPWQRQRQLSEEPERRCALLGCVECMCVFECTYVCA